MTYIDVIDNTKGDQVMARKVNHEIFQFLNVLFAAEKKLRRRLRRQLVTGKIDKSAFDLKVIAYSRAFDRRYGAIYKKFA